MMDRVSLAADAPKTALAAMVCPSQQVASPERAAHAVTALLAVPSAFPSGSSVSIGPQTFELVSVSVSSQHLGDERGRQLLTNTSATGRNARAPRTTAESRSLVQTR